MKPMKILIACESSGRVRDAFTRAGHFAMSCDLLATESPGPHYEGDVRDVLYTGEWDMMIAHPTCTRLTNSGVRWLIEPPKKLATWQYKADVVAAYAKMDRDQRLAFMWSELRDGADFYKMLRDAPIERKAIENPIMHCHASKIIQPGTRQVVQPWWFGDEAFKATGFELIGLPPLVATNRLTPPKSGTPEHTAWSKVHMASPGPNRWRDRSRFYPGMAEAMAQQWGKLDFSLHQAQPGLLAAA